MNTHLCPEDVRSADAKRVDNFELIVCKKCNFIFRHCYLYEEENEIHELLYEFAPIWLKEARYQQLRHMKLLH